MWRLTIRLILVYGEDLCYGFYVSLSMRSGAIPLGPNNGSAGGDSAVSQQELLDRLRMALWFLGKANGMLRSEVYSCYEGGVERSAIASVLGVDRATLYRRYPLDSLREAG